MCSIGKKLFSFGLVAQLFQPVSNWIETVEKVLVATAVVAQAPIAATCVISCVICTACMTLLVNKKDGVRVVHPLINFFYDIFF